MSIVARDNQKEYTPAPEGLDQAVCVDVVDKGLIETRWGIKPKVQIRWQTKETYTDEETQEEKRFIVVGQYTLSLNSKAKLRQHLEAWRSRKFTAKELEGFDLEKLVAANCQLQIVHNLADGGRVYANIQAIVPLGKGMESMVPLDYVRVKDRDDKVDVEDIDQPETDDDLPF